jgi:DNA-binding LacI/PurR family transcriptional regulator
MKIGQRPTLQTVADLAGVSKMTVSRCLRHHPSNSVATRDRIKKIADEVGYRPNPLVAALMHDIRSGSSGSNGGSVIAVLDDHVGERSEGSLFSWNEHMGGILQRADELGYRIEIIRYQEQKLNWDRLVRILWARNIRGLIVPYQSVFLRLDRADLSDFASVTLGYTPVSPDLDRICPDFFEGMGLALDAVEARGYRRIGHLIPDQVMVRTRGKSLACFQLRKATGRLRMDHAIFQSLESERDRLLKWMDLLRPEVILSERHETYDWLKAEGFRVPGDLAYVQLHWSGASKPRSGVKNRNRLQGIQAVNVVNAKLLTNDFGVPAEPMTHLVRNQWVEGDTLPPINRVSRHARKRRVNAAC